MCQKVWLVAALGLLSLSGQASAAGVVVLVAGGGDGGDGVLATKAKLQGPFAVDFDPSGNLIIAEMEGHRVRRVDAKGVISTIAGTGQKGFAGDGGPATKAEFNGMHTLAIAPSGDIFVADTWNNRVRRIDAKSGVISTFAGTGEKGFSGDGGPALKAQFGGVYDIAFDPNSSRLILADLDNHRVRSVDLMTGIVSTIAGNGKTGIPKDRALAKSEPLVDPRAVAVDNSGNVYIAERGGHALRVVSPDGTIRTVAGTGKAGTSGDGGPAKIAMLNGPKHLAIDKEGNVLIADTENHAIRKYLPKEGILVRVAGTGVVGSTGVGGSPDRLQMSRPHGVIVDKAGAIFIADSDNHRILKIENDGGKVTESHNGNDILRGAVLR